VPPYRQVPTSDRLRLSLGLAPDVRIALYQGNIQPDRELERLVLAAPYLEPKTVIVLMGKGFRGVPERLQELIDRLGVAERVKIIPPVPYDELLDWTASADIGLTIFSPSYSLSIRYTLPNKLFEYLMAGLPVLSLQLDAIAEVIRTYDVGLVLSTLDPAAIGAGINTLLADPKALAHMRERALEVARREFNWQKESPRLIHLYRRLLSLPGEEPAEA
jgi:glycosyltransferase involved in cell wall biosynthesis